MGCERMAMDGNGCELTAFNGSEGIIFFSTRFHGSGVAMNPKTAWLLVADASQGVYNLRNNGQLLVEPEVQNLWGCVFVQYGKLGLQSGRAKVKPVWVRNHSKSKRPTYFLKNHMEVS